MPPPTQPQPVTRSSGRASLAAQEQPVAGPSSHRLGASPMTGISFTNGGGFSFDKHGSGGMGRSVKMSGGGPGSYGARFYGGGFDSPSHPFSTSITMDGTSFTTSSAAFNLPPPLSTSSSFRGGRSYAAAAKGERDHPFSRGHPPNHHPTNLSTSFASMSFQPMSFSFGTGSYSKSQVHSLMVNAGRPRTDAELTNTYECCGHTHHGLHDLLEHVEDAHPFTDPGDTLPGIETLPPVSTSAVPGRGTVQHIGFSPQVLAMDMDMDVAEPPNMGTIEERASGGGSTRSSMSPISVPAVPSYPVPTSASSSKPSTPNETATSPAPLQISDVLTSPFGNSPLTSGPFANTSSTQAQSKGPNPAQTNSNASTSSSSPPEGSLRTPMTSAHPSPVFAVPKVGPTRGFLGSHPQSRLPQQRFDRAFNEVVAGSGSPKDKDPKAAPTAVAPGVLFASAVAGLGIPTTPPVPGQKPEQPKDTDGKAVAGDAAAQLPQPSLFTTHKPWRCPNPGCNKAYKQSNGLKYHQQKGQCDFAIHDAVDLGLSVEEAEERSRPFVCAVGAGCLKRYRQMNGLKYHYLNSGEHGQYGLRMMQNGTHPMPTGVPGTGSTSSNPGSTSSTPTATPLKRPATTSTSTGTIGPTSTQTQTQRGTTAPYHIPSQIGATRPRMGVFPTTTTNNPNRPGGLAGIGRAGVPVRPGQGPLHSNGLMQGQKPAPAPLPPIQRGRDAVLFAAVETMDL